MSGLCWANILDCSTDNKPRSSLSNAVLVLQHDPSYAPDRLHYDEFLDRVLTRDGDVIRQWRDDDDTRATVYMQQTVGLLTIAESHVASAVRYVARQRVRHCVRDYLSALTWDGVERLSFMLQDFWGVEPAANQPIDYIQAVSANMIRGLVARVLFPGCQLDTMVIFEGPQGIGKSRALRVLGGPWYALASESVTSKDFFQTLPGSWLVEIGEMDAMSKADRERTKLVISTPVDRYRPSYGRHVHDYPRQCIFAGTTNHDDYGNDDTGLRRLLPIRCGDIDIDGLVAVRDQLFAEALRDVRAGATWWELPPTAAQAQSDRQAQDVWTATVLDFVLSRPEVSLAEVLRDGLKLRDADMTRAHEIRVGRILKLSGWTKRDARRGPKVTKVWFAPE